MQSRSKSFKAGGRRQRGDILLESLIGIVLMSIIGLGMTYATSRAAVTQRDMKLQNIAVSQMRSLIAKYGKGLCPGSADAAQARITLPTQTQAVTLTVACTNTTNVSIGGVSIPSPTSTLGTVVLTTSSSDAALFGGIIRVGDET